MITIDGSQGEGGGQVLRSSLALSLVTGLPCRIDNIRARRKKPGLMKQHLAAVLAAQEVGDAETTGVCLGSSRVDFRPSRLLPGEYRFDVGTAGSAILVLQTVLPALIVASASSTLKLTGGTHTPLAPSFEFLRHAYTPLVERLGPRIDLVLDAHGFFPAGGGTINARIRPQAPLSGMAMTCRGALLQKRVTALVANLPLHIAERECREMASRSGWPPEVFEAKEVQDSAGPGNAMIVELMFENITEVLSGCGRRGVPAERVAADVWTAVEQYLESSAPIGTHLADQLLLPLALAAREGQASEFQTRALSDHALTHMQVIGAFLPEIDVSTRAIESAGGAEFVVAVRPATCDG